MGIRVRPEEVQIPEGDPFKNDLLERRGIAEILTPLIDGIDGPCVMVIDAAWGAGKTTFLKMWSQYLCNNGFPVVEFNAWETDHTGDPFVAIVAELTGALQSFKDESVVEKRRDMLEAAKKVALRAAPGAIRILTAGVLDVQPLFEEAEKLVASYAEDRVKKYEEAQESINGFKNRLQEMATSLYRSKGHPLIVMVDELDRCRPSYAVELIEVAKHLFAADHTVFVLTVNRDQLTHSIKALYGNEFDSTGYLRRLIGDSRPGSSLAYRRNRLAGGAASSASCTATVSTRSNSSPRPRWWWNAGPPIGRASSEPLRHFGRG